MITLILVSLLTILVHLLGTFAYSARIAGVLSGKLSLSMSTFNLLSLASRFANVLMIPLLSKKIESELLLHVSYSKIPDDYFFILAAAIIGSVLGMLLFERCIRLLFESVNEFTKGKNLFGIILKKGTAFFSGSSLNLQKIPVKFLLSDYMYLLLNMSITCVFTSATLAAIYTSYIVPQFRVTGMSLAFILNGFASFIYAIVIDPYISLLTDSANLGKLDFGNYYYHLRQFMYSRMAGVFLSLATFKFFAYAIIHSIALM